MKHLPAITTEIIDKVIAPGRDPLAEARRLRAEQKVLFDTVDSMALSPAASTAFKSGLHFALRCMEEMELGSD